MRIIYAIITHLNQRWSQHASAQSTQLSWRYLRAMPLSLVCGLL